MMQKVLLYVLIFAILLTPAHGAYAAGTTKKSPVVEVPTQLAVATVNLYCRFKVGSTYVSTSGSGVFIDERGVILTNAHVAQYFLVPLEKNLVKGACTVRAGARARDAYTASVLYFPSTWAQLHIVDAKKEEKKGTGENDFALLYVTGAKKGAFPPSFPSLSLKSSPEATENAMVTVVGYPTGDLTFDEIKSKLMMSFATTSITKAESFSGPYQDLITLADSAVGTSGISGGPVINSYNQVIGIATTRNTAENSRVLRAITTEHIERALNKYTNYTLSTLLAGDFARTASTTVQELPPDTLKVLTQRLLKNRRK